MKTLEVQNVSVEVEGSEVVHDASFSLLPGTLTLLTGKNGSGKSSLVQALMGHPHYHITQGTIVLNGENITHLPPHERAKRGLFLSFQHVPKVGGVSLGTFLHKAYEATQCREIPALEFYLSLKERVESLGLNSSLLDRPVSEGLSGGERKQSELIQLLAFEPKYALLDEIDSGVDHVALARMFETIRSLAESSRIGFLLISHHPTLEALLSPHTVYRMEGGRLTTASQPGSISS